MRIALAADHAGYRYKERIKAMLADLGHEVRDFGTDSEQSVDFPDFVFPAALAVAAGACDRAVVLGGSGNGEAMAANRVAGIRCALCWDEHSALMARKHNDANVLALGQRMMDEETALTLVRVWLDTPFDGGRHARRLAKLDP